MPIPDIFGVRARNLRLRKALADIDASTSELNTVSKQVLEIATKTEAVAERAEKLVGEISHEKSEPVTPWRLLRLVAFCVLCMLGAVVAVMFVPAAFSSPAPITDNPGGVAVGVEATGSKSDQAFEPFKSNNSTYVKAFYSEYSTRAEYKVMFSNAFAGRRFAIIFSGSAVLSNINVLTDVEDFSVMEGRCASFLDVPGGSPEVPCQVIYGKIPGPYAQLWRMPSDCDDENKINRDRTGLRFEGDAVHMNSRRDQFHYALDLPYVMGRWSLEGPSEEFQGLQLDRRYGYPSQEACQALYLDPTRKDVDVLPAPDKSDSRLMNWLHDDGATIIRADRHAEAAGNVLLATAGILAGLAIGFVPVIYEAWRERRRYSRSVKTQGQRDEVA